MARRDLSENGTCHFSVGGFCIRDGKVLLIYHPKINEWLPVGGHVEENETPDEALEREFREEVDLEVRIINVQTLVKLTQTNLRRGLDSPFYLELHSVGDHNHINLTYICEPIGDVNINLDKDIVKEFGWFTREELDQEKIPVDIRNTAIKAFEVYEEIKSKKMPPQFPKGRD